ncbi:MAG: hypothetical protein Q9162_000876 [Coniocarpon cinnabarinum]
MDYLQHTFYEASGWDPNNSYSSLNATARSLLLFGIPHGVRLNVSSLSSPNSATSYDFGHVGLINGSLSYLYSSLPLRSHSRSSKLDLREFVQGYRYVKDVERPGEETPQEIRSRVPSSSKPNTLLYGRLYLPQSTLEAMYLRRLSPSRQVQISYVSDAPSRSGTSLLALYQHDHGHFNTEYLYSMDSALLGFRGLYNFGVDSQPSSDMRSEQRNGRLSAGGELYYGLLNKSGGMSGGLRFTTLPRHVGFPYTMTLTMNPLVGSLTSTYAVKAGRDLALCSQFDFNFYSYKSGLRLGLELWKLRPEYLETEWARRLIRPGWKQASLRSGEDVSGVLKARCDQDWRIGILWEGRLKAILFSFGVTLDMHRRDQIFRAVGAELQFSS